MRSKWRPRPNTLLRGVDIHDSEVAAEGLRHAAGFEDAAHGELLAALHGVEGDFAADGEVVAVGELAGEDERIGLGEEDEGIVDDVLVGVVEIVIAEAAVAGHIDGEDQELALAGESGIGLGLDNRRGGTDLAERLDAFQHVFGESGVAGGDLELGLAGDALDGVVEGAQHAAVGGLHADEQRYSEHDAGGGEHAAQQVLADVGPA